MNVLVAVDDEVFGAALADFVAHHQWSPDTEFKVLHVVEPILLDHTGDVSYAAFLESTAEEALQRAKGLVGSVAAKIRTGLEGARVSEEVLEGHAKEAIIDTAYHWPADLIVVGSHGRQGMSRFILGSVSMTVVSHAPCSVVIVRLPGGADKKLAMAEARAVRRGV